MEVTTFIVDNFLENPDCVRESALKSNFEISGNFPGFRSNPSDDNYSEYVKHKLENILNAKIVEWYECFNHYSNTMEKQSTTSFQICLEDTTSWIHTDVVEWTGVLYLTPNAPAESGTAIYRHKPTGVYRRDHDADMLEDDDSAWEVISVIGNVYNRLALFKGNLYHKSLLSGFGHDKYSARLTQVFFFNTQPRILE
jgi:hypothetical protein